MGNKTQIEWVNRVYTGEKSRILCHFLFSLINPKPQRKPYRKVEEGTTWESSFSFSGLMVDFFFIPCCNTLKHTHTEPSNQNLIISIHSSPDSLGLCFVRGSPGMNIMQSIPTELLLHIEGGARWCQNMSEQCKPCLRARSKRLSLPFSSDLRFLPFC